MNGAPYQRGLFGAAVAHRIDQGQRGLAFSQIVANVFAHFGGVTAVIQQVVRQLECDAEGVAIQAQGFGLFAACLAENGGAVARGFKQHGRLAADDFHVGGFVGIGVAHLGKLQYLAFGNHVGRVGKDAHDVQLAEGNHHLEGSRIEEVADQYARRVAPEGIGGGASAAHVGGVHHVVMQQGGGMQEFNDGSQLVLVRTVRIAGSGAEQHHQGAQTFAAGADDVMADLFHEGYPGVQLVQDQLVDRSKVSGDRLVERQRAH